MECQRNGEILVSEGLIRVQDIEDAKSSNGSRVIGVGLPAYCLVQTLLRSAKADSAGILLSKSKLRSSTSTLMKSLRWDRTLGNGIIYELLGH